VIISGANEFLLRRSFMHARNNQGVAAPSMMEPMGYAGNGCRRCADVAGDRKIRFVFRKTFGNREALRERLEFAHGAQVAEECRAFFLGLQGKEGRVQTVEPLFVEFIVGFRSF
jgi:hypothetical protein